MSSVVFGEGNAKSGYAFDRVLLEIHRATLSEIVFQLNSLLHDRGPSNRHESQFIR